MADTQLAYRSLKDDHGIDVHRLLKPSHDAWDINAMQWHAFERGMPVPACGQSWVEGKNITFGGWCSLVAALDVVAKDVALLRAFCKVFGWGDAEEITRRFSCLLEGDEEDEEESLTVSSASVSGLDEVDEIRRLYAHLLENDEVEAETPSPPKKTPAIIGGKRKVVPKCTPTPAKKHRKN